MKYAKALGKEVNRAFGHRNGSLKTQRYHIRNLIAELRIVKASAKAVS